MTKDAHEIEIPYSPCHTSFQVMSFSVTEPPVFKFSKDRPCGPKFALPPPWCVCDNTVSFRCGRSLNKKKNYYSHYIFKIISIQLCWHIVTGIRQIVESFSLLLTFQTCTKWIKESICARAGLNWLVGANY